MATQSGARYADEVTKVRGEEEEFIEPLLDRLRADAGKKAGEQRKLPKEVAAMSKIRTANSVLILQRRLDAAERGDVDALELLGIHDELSRLERKWLMQIAEGSDRRQPGDPERLDEWHRRLAIAVRAATEREKDPELSAMLVKLGETIANRPAAAKQVKRP